MSSYTRLLQFHQHFRKFYARQFSPLLEQTGLSIHEADVLLFLANNPGYDTAWDIAVLRGLSKSLISQSVELLAAEGLLRRIPDSADRRVVHLAITPEGLPLAQEAQRIQNACGQRLMEGFSPQEAAQFQSFLERILDNGDALNEEVSQ